ncbi:MAG: alpha/beta fold hydrolase [Noviherbaspirillum sp.]
MIRFPRLAALAAALLAAGCASLDSRPQTADATPPIVFVHGNGDSAALWQSTFWRFESNGWPRSRLHAINLPYPLARDDDSKPQPGRSSTAEHRDYLKSEIEQVLKRTGASQVVLVGNSRGGNAIRNYIQTGMQSGTANVSHAILGGTPNHGVWSRAGEREGSEFAGTGPFLSALNAPKNAAGDEVVGPVRWMTIRSDSNDKFAQPDAGWPGANGKPTGVSHAGPELRGAKNVVIAGIDHRETSFSAPAFDATYRFITGRAPATLAIVPEAQVTLAGIATGSGLTPLDPKSGNFASNLPLPGARLEVYAVQAGGTEAGSRIGQALHTQTIGADGKWGPFRAQPGVPYEFVLSAPGYATTHIYRSGFPRSSDILVLRPERIAEADRAAKQIVLLTRPRGYLDAARDRILLDGRAPGGLPARGGMLATSKLLLQEESPRAVPAEFNGERLAGRSWSAADGHVTVLELTH